MTRKFDEDGAMRVLAALLTAMLAAMVHGEAENYVIRLTASDAIKRPEHHATSPRSHRPA